MFVVRRRVCFTCAVVAFISLWLAVDAIALREALIPMKIDPSERRVDHAPPRAPVVSLNEIWRGVGPVAANGGVWGAPSTGEWGSMQLTISGASDDRTPQRGIGYRFHYVDGKLPRDYVVTDEAYLLQSSDHLSIGWNDSAIWDQESFLFRMVVTAVDRAGNESAPSNVVIVAHDGDTSWYKTWWTARLEWEQSRRGGGQSLAHADSIRARTDQWRRRAIKIEDVYKPATIKFLGQIQSARVDYVENRLGPDRAGRKLSLAEVQQLKSILVYPRSYILDKYLCEFSPAFSFVVKTESAEGQLDFGSSCHMVRIRIDGTEHWASIFPLSASMIQPFCEGLMTLPELSE